MREISKIEAIRLLSNGKKVNINSEFLGKVCCIMNSDGSLTEIYSKEILSIYDFEEPDDKFYSTEKTNKDIIDVLIRNQKYIQLIDFILLHQKDIQRNIQQWLNKEY